MVKPLVFRKFLEYSRNYRKIIEKQVRSVLRCYKCLNGFACNLEYCLKYCKRWLFKHIRNVSSVRLQDAKITHAPLRSWPHTARAFALASALLDACLDMHESSSWNNCKARNGTAADLSAARASAMVIRARSVTNNSSIRAPGSAKSFQVQVCLIYNAVTRGSKSRTK